ncbi:MAG: acyltransferase [Propionibacteriaceae bacterium]|jgi:peptidoglycan/LPS O-acetylase OafA/YrhL|nr:acyltransferase [Propionibacteriaceae bacterium]
MKPDQVRQLTGVRIIAAMWVVTFHLKGNVFYAYPEWKGWLEPLIAHGDLGVDLFFALSGFILSYNYAERMGLRFERSTATAFWWARVARVWPVFVVTLVWATAYHGFLMGASKADPVAPHDFSPWSFFRQLTLTSLWTRGDFDRVMFNGPSWSVSAEAFAYALFPVVVLLYWRLGRTLKRGTLLAWSLVAVAPLGIWVFATDTLYPSWSWLLRIACGFTGGALMFQALRGLEPTPRQRAWASHAALGLVVVFVAGLYLSHHFGYERFAPGLSPLFVAIIGLLAIGDRHIVRLLSTRAFVTGGAASYSIYMVHMLIIEPVVGAEWEWHWLTPGTQAAKLIWLVLPVVVSVAGWALWRFFEEPARHALRAASKLARETQ